MLPTDQKERKERPIATGVLDYFPDAIAAIANVSFVGNQQHNPGQPMHWARHKSTDHADCVGRHLLQRGTLDNDGLRHSAKLAWRALALLQIEIEEEKENLTLAEIMGLSKPPADYVSPEGPSGPKGPDYHDGWCFTPLFDTPIDLWVRPLRSQSVYEHELRSMGCPLDVAKVIAGGMSFHTRVDTPQSWVYVAGPMRGHKDFNFPAFDVARDALLKKGYNVISPADIDRAAGFKVSSRCQDVTDTKPFVLRDFWSLFYMAHKGGAIALMPDWYRSTGASAEFFLARWLGLDVLNTFGEKYVGSPVQHFACRALR
jgi:hypothetical protein